MCSRWYCPPVATCKLASMGSNPWSWLGTRQADVRHRILVVGTGRCGTTALTELLGTHPEIYSPPAETHLLCDPDGLEDLVDALTDRYTTERAYLALSRFRTLATDTLCGRSRDIYQMWHLDRDLGQVRYHHLVDRLLDLLTWYVYDEVVPTWAPPRHDGTAYDHAPVHRQVGRYFPDRAVLVKILGGWFDELLGGAAAEHAKSGWCEKTPLNLLSLPFVWELFPDAAVVHITRDPRGVAWSHTRQPWAPHNLDDALSFLEPTYRRWLALCNDIDLHQHAYVQVRAEDLADNWSRGRAALLARLGLADAPLGGRFESERLNLWRDEMPIDQVHRVEERLGELITAMGYNSTSPP